MEVFSLFARWVRLFEKLTRRGSGWKFVQLLRSLPSRFNRLPPFSRQTSWKVKNSSAIYLSAISRNSRNFGVSGGNFEYR